MGGTANEVAHGLKDSIVAGRSANWVRSPFVVFFRRKCFLEP
jgi:hypothetical protein